MGWPARHIPKRSAGYINFLCASTVLRSLRELPPCSLHRQQRRHLYMGWFSQRSEWGFGGDSLPSDLTGTESTHISQWEVIEQVFIRWKGSAASAIPPEGWSGRRKAMPWEEGLAEWNAGSSLQLMTPKRRSVLLAVLSESKLCYHQYHQHLKEEFSVSAALVSRLHWLQWLPQNAKPSLT